MHIVFSSDDNYARHVGIAMTSLFDHDRAAEQIHVYIIDNEISEKNRALIDGIARDYGRFVHYIPFREYKEQLKLDNGDWELPISTYARLFVGEMLPKDIDRVLYLDCDTIICDSLQPLFQMDMQGKTVAAVEDVCSTVFRDETGVTEPYHYFCAGIILIDLNKWRKIDAQKQFMDYLNARNGKVRHHDQTILNGVFWNDSIMLHPRYDVLTPTFIMPYENLKAYFGLWDGYYSKQQIKESVKKPAIIHYTSSNIGRPWENNAHPKAKIYQRYWKASPWKDAPWGTFKPSYDAVQARTYWLYRHLPLWLIRLLSNRGGRNT